MEIFFPGVGINQIVNRRFYPPPSYSDMNLSYILGIVSIQIVTENLAIRSKDLFW